MQLGYTDLHELGSGVRECLSQLAIECFGRNTLELRAGHDQVDAPEFFGEPMRARPRKRPLDATVAAPIIGKPRDIASDDNDTLPFTLACQRVEAKWLMPAGTLPEDAASDPKSCLIEVMIELREHPIAHAARVLRESGATPAQTKVGIQLAFGKTKPVIADELGIQLSSIADVTKKLYQNLDVHNSAELGMKIWLGQSQDDARQSMRRAG